MAIPLLSYEEVSFSLYSVPFAGLRTKVLGISFGESADRSSLRWCCAKSIGGIDFNCFGVARKNLMEYISCVTVNNGDASRIVTNTNCHMTLIRSNYGVAREYI